MRKTLAFIIIVSLFISALSVTASADTGPKPSVVVKFQHLDDGECWGTLLSYKESTGPATVWDGKEENARHNENEHYSYSSLDYKTWKAFAEYEDPDGFYFLQEGWKVSETGQINWTYYPPQKFKILLYFPESGKFVSSGVCERYAFDSYFSVDLSLTDLSSVSNSADTTETTSSETTDTPDTAPPESESADVTLNVQPTESEQLTVKKDYDFTLEIISLVSRILLTLAIEILIALMFGYVTRKQLVFIVCVNAVTQVLLNVLLNVINYQSGELAFVLSYILFEIIVFAVEAVLYFRFMQKFSRKRINRGITVLYALVANTVSFAGGLMISHLIPGIF